jgi:hypothetical protein
MLELDTPHGTRPGAPPPGRLARGPARARARSRRRGRIARPRGRDGRGPRGRS